MTGIKLQFWFEFASTYSYLSAMRIEATAERVGIDVDWQPFLLGPIFSRQGWASSPFNLYPAKGRYMWRDMDRRCAALKLPFQRPDPFPQNSLLAARVALTVRAPGQRPAFCRAVYSAQFGAGRDISDPDVLRDCLDQAGLDNALLEQATTPNIKSVLRQQGERAQQLGLFGAPSFVVGTDLYWGDDRLDEALDFAAQMSPAPQI